MFSWLSTQRQQIAQQNWHLHCYCCCVLRHLIVMGNENMAFSRKKKAAWNLHDHNNKNGKNKAKLKNNKSHTLNPLIFYCVLNYYNRKWWLIITKSQGSICYIFATFPLASTKGKQHRNQRKSGIKKKA